MPTITGRDIPDESYAALKTMAKAHGRPVSGEVIYCIEQAVPGRRIDVESAIAQARELRTLTAGHPISDDELIKAKNCGRP